MNVTVAEEMVFTKYIIADTSYQRDLDPKKVKCIASNFDPLKMNRPKVSYRDGKYYVFDGNHSVKAAILHNNNEDLEIKCLVYRGLTRDDEARLFASQHDLQKKVSKNEMMRALCSAGDQELVELKNLVRAEGFAFDFTGGKKENKIVCCEKMLKLYRKSKSTADFSITLQIVKEAWHGEPESLRGEIIGAVWLFWTTYKGDAPKQEIVRMFAPLDPADVYKEARKLDIPGDKRYAYYLTEKYNFKKSTNRLDVTRVLGDR